MGSYCWSSCEAMVPSVDDQIFFFSFKVIIRREKPITLILFVSGKHFLLVKNYYECHVPVIVHIYSELDL